METIAKGTTKALSFNVMLDRKSNGTISIRLDKVVTMLVSWDGTEKETITFEMMNNTSYVLITDDIGLGTEILNVLESDTIEDTVFENDVPNILEYKIIK